MSRVLVVDDKEENRYLLETLLRGGGYEVESAVDGMEALEKVRKGNVGLIISDILMPRMDGFQLCRECKKDKSLSDIPLVFYTSAYTDRRDEEFALELGAVRFLTKPMEPQALLEVVRELGDGAAVKPAAAPPPIQEKVLDDEDSYLREYSERLVGQLEKKMLELEEEIAIRKKAEGELQWELTVNKAIARLSNTLISSPASIGNIAAVVLDSARGLTGSEHGFVSSIDPRTGDNIGHTLTSMMKNLCMISGGDRRLVFSPDGNGRYGGLWGHALNTHKAFYANSPENHPSSEGVPEGHVPLRNFLTVPAMISMNLVGQIALANKDGDYTDAELEAVRRLAEIYALALQRKRAEMALEDSEERLRATIEGIGDSIVILDEKMSVFWANRIAKEQYGDLVGRKCPEVFRGGKGPGVDAVVKETFGDGEIRSAEVELLLPEGAKSTFLITASPMIGQEKKIDAVVVTFKDITRRKREAEELRTSREQLRNLSAHMEKVREEERAAMAREVHDDLGQSLTALKMDVSWLGKKLDLKALSRKTEEMTKLIDDTVMSVQRISRELRPGVLDDLGLGPAIEWQAGEFSRRSGIDCDVSVEPEEIELERQQATAIFRIFQETLTNVSRHSEAKKVRVAVRDGKKDVSMEVSDDGKGAREADLNAPTAWGVTGMRERVSFLGGEFSIEGRKGEGTIVKLVIPKKKRGEAQ